MRFTRKVNFAQPLGLSQESLARVSEVVFVTSNRCR